MSTLSKSETAKRIADAQATIKEQQKAIAGYKKHPLYKKGWKFEYAISNCELLIRRAKAEIAVLKKAQKEAAKKPVNKTLFVEKRGMDLDHKEYPDSDFPSHRLCFEIIDKNGFAVFVEASPWHKPKYTGKRGKLSYEKNSVVHFHPCYENGRGCFGCWDDNITTKATKAELLKWVNKIARDNYTRISFKD